MVVEADNGRTALTRLVEQPPDAIVLDLIMPEMDGFEFIAELRARPDGRNIPVIVVTAMDLSQADRDRLQRRCRPRPPEAGHRPANAAP